MDEDAPWGWGEEVEDGHVEGPGKGDEVVGGELADAVAGDGAFCVGDHGFGPLLASHRGEEAGHFGLGEPAALSEPDQVAGDDLVGGPGGLGGVGFALGIDLLGAIRGQPAELHRCYSSQP